MDNSHSAGEGQGRIKKNWLILKGKKEEKRPKSTPKIENTK